MFKNYGGKSKTQLATVSHHITEVFQIVDRT